MEALRIHFDRIVRQSAKTGAMPPTERVVVLLNPASLWWVAYGELAVYRESVVELAKLLAASGLLAKAPASVLLWTGTAVNPIQYRRELASSNKRCMTRERVAEVNRATVAALKAWAPQVRVVDLWELSATREDDPLAPHDMRHNSPQTYVEMASVVLRSIASPAAL